MNEDKNKKVDSELELAAENEEIKSRKLKYGTMATVFTVIFIIAVIIANVFIGYLTDRFVLEVDMTRENLFEISDDTKEVLADLSEPVVITVLAEETTYKDSTDLYANIYEILQRYDALAGDMLRVNYINPAVNPQVLKQYNLLSDLSTDDIIIESDRRYQKLSPYNLYTYSQGDSEDESSYYYVGLRAEQKLTSAIVYVTQEKVEKAAFITGHEEKTDLTELQSVLTLSNFEIVNLSLSQEDIPEEVSLLIISAPNVDYGTEEIDKLEKYCAEGGDMIVALSAAQTNKLTNLEGFFEEWGVQYTNTLVLDKTQCLSGYPNYVVPDVIAVEAITNYLNSSSFAVIATPRAINMSATQTGQRTVTPLMMSSDTSYGKNTAITDGTIKDYDYNKDTDVKGPYTLAALSEDIVYDRNYNVTRSSVMFCTSGFISDSILSAENFLNRKYLLAAVNYISDNTDAVIIGDKDFQSTTLTLLGSQVTTIFWLLVVALPLIILAAGMVIWIRRRHL